MEAVNERRNPRLFSTLLRAHLEEELNLIFIYYNRCGKGLCYVNQFRICNT